MIFDDAPLEEAVDGLIASKFRNAGQTCVCANRVYVQRGVYDEVVALLTEKVEPDGRSGPATAPGVTIGPLIDERARRQGRRSTSRTRSGTAPGC